MRQLFRLLFTAIAAVCLFCPTNVISSSNLSDRQNAVNKILSQYMDAGSFRQLHKAGITIIHIIKEVPAEAKDLLVPAAFKLKIFAAYILSGELNKNKIRKRLPSDLEGPTLIVDSYPRRLQLLSPDYVVLEASNPYDPQSWKSLSTGRPSVQWFHKWSKSKKEIQQLQEKVDAMISAKDFKFNKETDDRLTDFGIRNLIIVAAISDDFLEFQTEAAVYGISVYYAVVFGSPTDIKKSLLKLLSPQQLEEMLLVDWKHVRIAGVADILAVAQNLPKFCTTCMRPYWPTIFEITQGILNRQVTPELAGTSKLVRFLQKGGVRAVAIDFYGPIVWYDVWYDADLDVTRNKFERKKDMYKVSEYFRNFVSELQQMGIALFIVDNNTERRALPQSRENILAGRDLIFKTLIGQGIKPAAVYTHSLKITDEVPQRSIQNLRLVEDDAKFQPKEILFISNNILGDICCAAKVGYLVLFFDNMKVGHSGWHASKLLPVELAGTKACAAVCEVGIVKEHKH